ncbi:hypothetical protein PISMIDRAFT_681052 [Pisolithus microcarpus 441]|uniref:Manganese/iron superoxide dismutase C-terminal domain-containing protein n=1 Tax=Pisolithus microcarpus 441 TaxID=765257 RepID=A0A0C9ZGY9_9AGAM|nr:hypothetical protein PISMIDRAFT_681052 [Pisolithus microcarpus 441]
MAIALPRSVFLSSRSVLSTFRSSICPQGRVTRRTLHTRKELPYKIEDGLGNFMSPRTLQMVAEEYQQGLLDRLNEYLRDTDDRRKTIAQVVLDTAERPDKTMTFRYASHALNNSFFLNCLRPPTGDFGETDVERSMLGPAVRKQFGNFDTLRSQFSAAVLGMSGSGYVWFVTDAKGNLAFVPTFAAGTLLVRSRTGTVDPLTQPVLGEGPDIPLPNQNNHHSIDQPPSSGSGTTPTSPTTGTSYELPPRPPNPLSRMLHTSVSSQNLFSSHARSVYDPATGTTPLGFMNDADMRDLKTIGEHIYPLFCVSVHEHCWLLDHGIWGKEKYLKEFWSVVDWQQVVRRFDTFPATGNI